jgi:hypothetical protein
MELNDGALVNVVEFGGRVLVRRVIADKGEKVVVCPDDEYRDAERKNREPIGISFPKRAVSLCIEPAAV